MGDTARAIGADTTVTVMPSAEDRTVQVRIGSNPGVIFVGTLADIHRTFVEVDTQISRLTRRGPSVSLPQ